MVWTVFNHCKYLGKEGDINLVELGYKLPFGKTLAIRTRVWAPTPYQVRNEVYDGLGVGTIIESHITPIHADRSIIHEIYHVPGDAVPSQAWPIMRYFMRKAAVQIREEDSLFFPTPLSPAPAWLCGWPGSAHQRQKSPLS